MLPSRTRHSPKRSASATNRPCRTGFTHHNRIFWKSGMTLRLRLVQYSRVGVKDGQFDLGAVRLATGIFTLPEVIPSADPCGSEPLGGHGVVPDIAGRPKRCS